MAVGGGARVTVGGGVEVGSRGAAEGDGVVIAVGATGEGVAVRVGVDVGSGVQVEVSVSRRVAVLLAVESGTAVCVGPTTLVVVAGVVGLRSLWGGAIDGD